MPAGDENGFFLTHALEHFARIAVTRFGTNVQFQAVVVVRRIGNRERTFIVFSHVYQNVLSRLEVERNIRGQIDPINRLGQWCYTFNLASNL